MTATPDSTERLRFLLRVVGKQAAHVLDTDRRLFAQSLKVETLRQLESDVTLAERIEAFVSRFARLQDTVGDKLLPALLAATGETTRTVLENLDRAEKLGWIASVDQWLSVRKLRNQMVHEYVEDLAILADALNLGHESVPMLVVAAETLRAEANRLLL